MIIHKSRKAILASKMFKSSARQKEILAAMELPENVELVQQLDEYLDDEYLTIKRNSETQFTEDTSESIEGNPDTSDMSDGGDTSTIPRRSAGGGSPAKFTPNESLMDKHGDELAELEGEEPDMSSNEPKEPNASVQRKGKAIVADTIVNPFVDLYADLIGIANEIKGTLNARQDTAGVSRVQMKNDELWVYYNDDINLNNVMTNVLNVLNAANYKYFEFNRLARTDNAMVFTVSIENTGCSVQAVVSDEK